MMNALRRKSALLFASFAFVGLGGCHRPSAPDPDAPAPTPGTVRLSPAKLFTGELKRLEPHLGLSTGFVRLDFADPNLIVELEPEVWEAGKPVRSLGSSCSPVGSPAEVSFSLQSMTDHTGRRKYRLITADSTPSGGSAWTIEVDQPEPDPGPGSTMSGPRELTRPRELAEGESVIVWAYRIGKPVPGTNEDMSSPESAIKAARWALAIKLRWFANWERVKDR